MQPSTTRRSGIPHYSNLEVRIRREVDAEVADAEAEEIRRQEMSPEVFEQRLMAYQDRRQDPIARSGSRWRPGLQRISLSRARGYVPNVQPAHGDSWRIPTSSR